MKALTLWRPWPWAIFFAGAKRKLIENRPRAAPRSLIGTGQPLILHAGKTWDEEGAEFITQTLGLTSLPVAAWQEGLIGKTVINSVATRIEDVPEDQRAWFFGPVAMVLDGLSTIALPSAIPFKGKQGYFDLPTDVAQSIYDTLYRVTSSERTSTGV